MDMTEPRYDGWLWRSPTFLASPTFPHQAPLLSPVECLICAIPHTTELHGWQGHPGHPQTPRGDPGPHSRHLCCSMGRKLGLYRCLRLAHPKPAVLASLKQYVPSVLGHSSHSQSPGVAGRFCPGEQCRGPLELCATQVRMGTPAFLLLTWSSPRNGPIAGDTLVSLCPPWCIGSASHHPAPRESRPGLWWLPAAAVTLVYYTVLISNFSLFKRTLKTLFFKYSPL